VRVKLQTQLAGAALSFRTIHLLPKKLTCIVPFFHKHYPEMNAAQTVRKWIPRWQENEDPSGRANAAHMLEQVGHKYK
jgi:asparagine synthase (glutamine-hydrolysing)